MEKFEGYSIPECTEEEIKETLNTAKCVLRNNVSRCAGITSCSKCLLGVEVGFQKEFDQTVARIKRYLELDKTLLQGQMRPIKVAVRCETQEEWDRVCEKAHTEGKQVYDSFSEQYREGGCITLAEDDLHLRWQYEGYYKAKGYKIISAKEFLGEEIESYTADVTFLDEAGEIRVEALRFPPSIDTESIERFKEKYLREVVIKVLGIPPDLLKPESEDTMSMKVRTYIVVVYKGNVDEAVLVDKHFGSVLDDTFDKFTRNLWLTDKKDEYLKEAQRLEAKDQAMKDAAKG